MDVEENFQYPIDYLRTPMYLDQAIAAISQFPTLRAGGGAFIHVALEPVNASIESSPSGSVYFKLVFKYLATREPSAIRPEGLHQEIDLDVILSFFGESFLAFQVAFPAVSKQTFYTINGALMQSSSEHEVPTTGITYFDKRYWHSNIFPLDAFTDTTKLENQTNKVLIRMVQQVLKATSRQRQALA
jgi:hypothetical protein